MFIMAKMMMVLDIEYYHADDDDGYNDDGDDAMID